MVDIRPMNERYIHVVCQHDGPVDTSSFTPVWERQVGALPPHPWGDATIARLAADHGAGLTHGWCKSRVAMEFMREMVQRYGTCALLAWQGEKVVGHIRFYPMTVARLVAKNASAGQDPSPGLDPTSACEPERDAGTLWVQCVMTCPSYQDSEGAALAGARKGVGLRLARALVLWARERGWRRIVKVAHCDLDWFYGVQGGGGRAFWEKVGFEVTGSFHRRAFDLNDDARALVDAQMVRAGVSEEEVWTWYRMECLL